MKSFTYLQENPPLGHIKGYNRMFKRANGKFIAWFNDDCQLLPNWDIIAYDFMRKHKKNIGAIHFADPDQPYRVYIYQKLTYPNFGVLTKNVGNRLNWFDERLYMYGADTAMAIKGALIGHYCLPIPGCRIQHYRPPGGWKSDLHTNQRKKDYWRFCYLYDRLLPHIPQSVPRIYNKNYLGDHD